MAKIISSLMRSEKQARLVLGSILLILVPLFLLLTVFAGGKFQDLRDPAAMDRAQLARNVASGKGFATNFVRPLSRFFYTDDATADNGQRQLHAYPDLYNAPAYPALQGAVFWTLARIGMGPSDIAVALIGAALWLVSVWLTFLVARHWFGWGIGMLAALLYGSNVAALTGAMDGSLQPLLTVCVLLAVWVGVPSFQYEGGKEEGSAPKDAHGFRILATGLLCGIAALTHYVMAVFALILVLYIAAAHQRKLRAVSLFVLGFLLPMVPWMVRNFLWAGSPFFSLFSYEIMANTRSFPGDSIFRMVPTSSNPLPNPFYFIITHPIDMIAKAVAGFIHIQNAVMRSVGAVVGIVLLVVLFSGVVNRRWRRFLIYMVGALVATLAVSCLTRVETALVGVWVPLFAIGVAAYISDWVQERVGEYNYGNVRNFLRGSWTSVTDDKWRRSRLLRYLQFTPRMSRVVVYAALTVVTVFPLLMFLQTYRPEPSPVTSESVRLLQQQVPEASVVLTDVPAQVAWHAERRALWLFQKEETLAEFERANGPVGASYITGSIGQVPKREWGDWWRWIVSTQGIYRNLVLAETIPGDAVLRLHVKKSPAEKSDADLEGLLSAIKKNPSDSDLQLRLGQYYLKHDRLCEADGAFAKAYELDPQNLEAFLARAQVSARLSDFINTLAIAQRVLELNPDDPSTAVAFEAADKTFRQAMAWMPNNPWLLVQTGLLQARQKRWDDAKKYFQLASTAASKNLPERLLIGLLYMQEGHLEEAVSEFEGLVQLQPDNPVAREALGEAYLKQRRFENALTAFVEAQRLRPNWFRAYVNAGYTCMVMQKFGLAVEYYEKALELSPNSLIARSQMADALGFLGKKKEAIERYEKILVDYPDDFQAMNNLAVLYADPGNNLERALDLAQRAYKVAPRTAVTRDTLGWTYHLMGRREEALQHLEEAAKLAPDIGIVQYHFGKALLAGGRRQEALAAFRTALSKGLPADAKADAEREALAP